MAVPATKRAAAWGKILADLAPDNALAWGSASHEYRPPTKRAIEAARSLVLDLQGRGFPTPQVFSPDGDGGLTLEWHEGDQRETRDIEERDERGLFLVISQFTPERGLTMYHRDRIDGCLALQA